MAIRNGCKAMVIDVGKILLNRCVWEDGRIYYDFPGGGQLQYESMEDCLQREVLEETGYTVDIIRFAALSEEICTNETLRQRYPEYTHRVYHYFVAKLRDRQATEPTELDLQMEKSEWVPIEALDTIEIRPQMLDARLREILENDVPVWLGTDYVE